MTKPNFGMIDRCPVELDTATLPVWPTKRSAHVNNLNATKSKPCALTR